MFVLKAFISIMVHHIIGLDIKGCFVYYIPIVLVKLIMPSFVHSCMTQTD